MEGRPLVHISGPPVPGSNRTAGHPKGHPSKSLGKSGHLELRRPPNPPKRSFAAWASGGSAAAAAQLRNKSWAGVFDTVQVRHRH